MSILNFESQMSGMPSGKKKTRRGGRGRAKGPVGDPNKHLANVQAALQADDHATAKTHAFALMRSLHAKTAAQAAAAPPIDPVQPPTTVEPQDAASAQRARLAKTLHGLGK